MGAPVFLVLYERGTHTIDDFRLTIVWKEEHLFVN